MPLPILRSRLLRGPRLAAAGALAALAACGAGAEAEREAPSRAGPARLAPAEAAHDFGGVLEGSPLRHRFELAAEGSEPVRIRKLHKSCGCTAAELLVVDEEGEEWGYELDSELGPGERLAIEVEFDTSGRPGPQDRPLALYGNVPGGRVELRVLAQVEPLLVTEPAALDLGDVLLGQEAGGELELTLAHGGPARIRLIEAGLPRGFDVNLVVLESDAQGRAERWRLDVQLNDEMFPGVGRWFVPLEIGLPRDALPSPLAHEELSPSLAAAVAPLFVPARATVAARVLPIVAAVPQSTQFSMLDAGLRAERRVALTIHDPDFRLGPDLALDVELRDIAGEPIEIQPFEARLELDPPALVIWTEGLPPGLQGELRGRVEVNLAHPAQAALTVGFSLVATGR